MAFRANTARREREATAISVSWMTTLARTEISLFNLPAGRYKMTHGPRSLE
jgi:hypothetical protein